MKQMIRFALILMIGGLIIAGGFYPRQAAAQGGDVDTVLAPAVVKGYLSSLTRSRYSPTLASFYLTEAAAASPVAQSLISQPIDSFEIVEETWVDDNLYRARATLSPGGQALLIEVSKGNSRWQIVRLDGEDGSTALLPSPPPPQPPSGGSVNISPSGGSVTAATAEILSLGLNVRAGPGLEYPVQSVLNQGDQVEIVGVNSTLEWYQVAQGGQVSGWISASPTYVAASPADVELPVVSAPPPPPPSGGSVNIPPSGGSGGGSLILQTHSGGDFYLVNADGTNLRRLSSGIDPALSPDGRYAAFTRWGSGEVGALWLHDLATGEERAILGEMLQPKSPTWSPDGAKVVVSFQHGGRREEEHKCVSLSQEIPHRAFDVRFKINEICFKLPPDPFWQLRLIDLATGAYQDLPSETYSYAPTWDPANPWRVVFAGSTGLQQLDLNRQEYFPFTRDLRDRGPVFSPDGGQVAVTYKQHGHWEVYTVSAADGSRLRLTPISILRETFNSAAPAWSPDGQQIAFVTDRNGRWEFWVMNADGSDPRPLLPPEVAAQIPVEYHGVDERLISWAAAGSGPTAGALLAAGAGEAEPQAEADASQIAAGAAEAPPQAEAETEEAKDDLAAAPPPEVLPVTGWGRLLVFPFVILIVVALLVKGAGSIRKGLHMN